MERKEFLYHLPPRLIAANPAPERSDSRLMVVERLCSRISHHRFSDLASILRAGDLLVLTADHGCDPCPCSESTDHSREYVPILTYSREGKRGVDLGTRATLADMGQTVAENFGGAIPRGESLLALLL